MALTLWYHPFASFCQKVLIALYETGASFEPVLVDLGDPNEREALARVWPLAKFPVLRDDERGVTLPESTIIIEHLALHHPGPSTLVPVDPDAALQVRLLDRFFDHYVMEPMQKIVADTFRPAGCADPTGVEQARTLLDRAYDLIEKRLADRGWAAGDDFTLADCAAAPALFYSNIMVPFARYPTLAAYYRRLLERPSVARVIEEARPYRSLFPLEWPADY